MKTVAKEMPLLTLLRPYRECEVVKEESWYIKLQNSRRNKDDFLHCFIHFVFKKSHQVLLEKKMNSFCVMLWCETTVYITMGNCSRNINLT
jgi:hypothetical protein